MKTRLEQVLERHLKGREIAVWGTPTHFLLRALKPYKYHMAETVDPAKHYVVTVTDDEMDDFLDDEQGEAFKYVEDCVVFSESDTSLPFEWECHGISIGRGSYFGERFVNGCEYGFVESIGRYTSISSTAVIQANHAMNMMFSSDDIQDIFTEENLAAYKAKKAECPKYRRKRVKIGNDVWIGANSFIHASNVKSIGDGAIIGAGAVVLEDVPPYAVVVGVPAKIKRYRFSPEMIETLLRVKWWDWSFDEINANADALMSPEIFMERFGLDNQD